MLVLVLVVSIAISVMWAIQILHSIPVITGAGVCIEGHRGEGRDESLEEDEDVEGKSEKVKASTGEHRCRCSGLVPVCSEREVGV